MKKPTIQEIKRLTEEHSPYFFDRKTMRFFGQTLKDFHVEKTETEGIFRLYAKRCKIGTTERFYLAGSGRMFLTLEGAIDWRK